MVQTSDRKISTHVWASHGVLYKSPAWRVRIHEQAALIEHALPVFHELMHLPENISVRLAGLKARNLRGRYIDSRRLVEISASLKGDQLLTTLAHELVHAEQYNTGKLKNEWSNRGWVHQWEGDMNYNKGSTYKAYRNQPWEIEAFGREKILADVVWHRIRDVV